mmetsp:Transcript_121048/g.337812  ORF Transcript_121048/g.337812 Transcript_121048/m.337812 type:complete len:421 (+) Transcript_121048:82-1344(+)
MPRVELGCGCISSLFSPVVAAAYGTAARPAGAAKAEGRGKASFDDVVSSGDRARVFEWEQRGAPWQLLISAGTLVAKQYAALALICLQVFFIGSGERKYLMSCNPFVIGWGGAYFCEYSKTCVRCFPLMAMVVSLVVAARLILNQRAFYLLLRRGVLVDFDNFRPLSDPLTWILLWTLASAFCHFLFDMWKTAGSAKDFRTIDPEGVIVFYFAPAIYFMMFLYSSYDIEEMLMPLSKFWEEDPEWARRASAGLVFVHERSLAKAVLRQGLRLEPRAEEAAEALRPVPAERHAAEELQRLGAAEAAAEEAGEEDLHADFELSRWRHVSAMWASQLLLDSGLQDDQSRHFCWMWLVFCATSAAAMLFALFFFAYQIYTDVGDIFWPPYENTDIPSLVVETLYLLFTGMIAWRFWKNLLGYTL